MNIESIIICAADRLRAVPDAWRRIREQARERARAWVKLRTKARMVQMARDNSFPLLLALIFVSIAQLLCFNGALR